MASSTHTCRVLFTALLLTFASNASATLIDRGSGLIYDDVLEITWLQEASLGGFRTWDDAVHSFHTGDKNHG